MNAARRTVLLFAFAALCAGVFGLLPLRGDDPPKGAKKMHGLIGKMSAVEGKRDELINILLAGTKEMPGCLSYIVAKDPADANAIWVTEVWDDQASHKASLSLPAVRTAITKGKPLIAKFDQSVTTEPVGGHGLTAVKGR
jgi:quinol monooxygenase YgiN